MLAELAEIIFHFVMHFYLLLITLWQMRIRISTKSESNLVFLFRSFCFSPPLRCALRAHSTEHVCVSLCMNSTSLTHLFGRQRFLSVARGVASIRALRLFKNATIIFRSSSRRSPSVLWTFVFYFRSAFTCFFIRCNFLTISIVVHAMYDVRTFASHSVSVVLFCFVLLFLSIFFFFHFYNCSHVGASSTCSRYFCRVYKQRFSKPVSRSRSFTSMRAESARCTCVHVFSYLHFYSSLFMFRFALRVVANWNDTSLRFDCTSTFLCAMQHTYKSDDVGDDDWQRWTHRIQKITSTEKSFRNEIRICFQIIRSEREW